MNHLEKVKNFIRSGKVVQLTQWAKENKVINIDRLIDLAAKEIAKEKK
jgi:hypothetical protein